MVSRLLLYYIHDDLSSLSIDPAEASRLITIPMFYQSCTFLCRPICTHIPCPTAQENSPPPYAMMRVNKSSRDRPPSQEYAYLYVTQISIPTPVRNDNIAVDKRDCQHLPISGRGCLPCMLHAVGQYLRRGWTLYTITRAITYMWADGLHLASSRTCPR